MEMVEWLNWAGDSQAQNGSLYKLDRLVRVLAHTVTGPSTTNQIEFRGLPGGTVIVEYATSAAMDAAFADVTDRLGTKNYYALGTSDVLFPQNANRIYVPNSTTMLFVDAEQINMGTAAAAQAKLDDIRAWLGGRRLDL